MNARNKLALLTIAAVVTVVGAPITLARGEISMQALLNENGSGRLFVNDPGERFSWKVCAPSLSSCAPFKGGREISTRGTPRNSVFRVESNGEVGVSPIWTGRVKSLTPPSVRGAIRANELVTPQPGRWSGGWKGEDTDTLQLAACDTRDGRGCTTLTHSHYIKSCRSEAAVLDPVFVGDYLRVADQRRGAGPIFEAAYGVTSPYGWNVLRRNRITAVAYLGPIASATGPRTRGCGPPPLLEEPGAGA